MLLFRAALLTILATSFCAAGEPQWIWSHKEAATKVEAGDVAFRKSFSIDGAAESARIVITADNSFDLFVNGRHLGSGDNWMQRTRFDIKPLLVPGRNLLAVRATNGGPDPAGLAAQVEIQVHGKEAIQISTDATWKFATKLGGRWATPEFDDSKWASAVALGEYGKTSPWGAAGAIVEAKSAEPVAKPKNTEHGLFDFKDGDWLVLLGSAFIERMQTSGYFELELISAFPDKNITVRNLGWSGDTVWGDARAVFGTRADGFKRLISDVHLCDPTVILVCYGENEAYAGDAGLDDFRAGYSTLLDALEKTGARIVVATPRKHENVGKPFPDPAKYNADLRKYCDVMKEVARERELTFVDWFDVVPTGKLTENGIHLTPYGYSVAAPRMVAALGGLPRNWSLGIDVARNVLEADGTLLTDVSQSPTAIRFTAQDRRLTKAPVLGSDLPPDAFASASRNSPLYGPPMFRFRGLQPGTYELLIDGKLVAQGSAEQWELSALVEEMAFGCERELKLLAAINEKSFLFFNRHRPQNETYLFLFRKHEQGNNAVEIPQFDPLIAEQEKLIAELKKPPKQKFELRRVGN